MFSRFEPTYKGEVRSPMSKRSFYSLLSVAVVGVLLAIMIFPLGIFAHPHDPPETDHVHYSEDSTDPVQTFESKDPEKAGIIWSVRGIDADDFNISGSGVLTFREQPDFENPTDRAQAEITNDPDDIVAVVTGGDNDYQITVSATEVWNGSDESLPAKRSDIDLTVTVGNVDDAGKLTLEWLQAEVGMCL